MGDFERKEKVNYQLINYDLTLKNHSNLKCLQQEAEKLSLQILQKYSKFQIKEMLNKEYDRYINLIVAYSNTLFSKSDSSTLLEESFGDLLINKLFFLYENDLIEKEMFGIFLEKNVYAFKYYFNETNHLYSFQKSNIKFLEDLRENIIKLYKRDLINKDSYNKLIEEMKQLKKVSR